MEGQNADLIKAQLRRKGITPLKVRKQSAKAMFAGGAAQRSRPPDIAIFARQLATMMSAGVPLVQAFDIIGQGHENKRHARAHPDD